MSWLSVRYYLNKSNLLDCELNFGILSNIYSDENVKAVAACNLWLVYDKVSAIPRHSEIVSILIHMWQWFRQSEMKSYLSKDS